MGASVTDGNEDLATSILEPLFTFDGDDTLEVNLDLE